MKSETIKSSYFIDLDNIKSKEKTYLTHNFHPYPAKYIPQIPGSIIDYLNLDEGSTILDPFSGSGTTLVEGVVRGHNAIGVDSNPISALISKVKSTPLGNDSMEAINEFLSRTTEFQDKMPENVDLPEFKNRDHWFQRNMLTELVAIKHEIEKIEVNDASDFLYTALSAITVKCSNQENDTRWVAKNKNLPDGYAINAFLKKTIDMIQRIKEFSLISKGHSKVYKSDSRNLFFVEPNSVDSIITSPPYMNSYDYYLYHKLRMFLIGFNHYEAQDLEIGSRNKHSDHNQDSSIYFDSIRAVGEELFRVAKLGGTCSIVIGDSIVNGELVDMGEGYTELFSNVGFQLVDHYSFDQRKYTTAFTKNLKTKDKKSHILIFKK